MAKISVIIPVYNVENYIGRCLDSILAQTHSNFDIILINDGSTDNSGRICDEYAKKDSRINVLHQHNQGVAVARNVGLDWIFNNSDSEWFAFIDSDDWVNPSYLQFLLEACLNNNSFISICNYERKDKYESMDSYSCSTTDLWLTEDFFIENHCAAVVPWGKLYKKELFKDIRYPVGKIHEDEFVTYKILFQYERTPVINEKLYNYFINKNGIVHSYWNPARMYVFEAIDERIEFFKSRNMDKLYRWQVNKYITYLCNYYFEVDDLKNPSFEKYLIILKRRLRRDLIKYRKLIEIPKDDMLWRYELAFPKLMNFYWTFVGIKNKIKKKR